MKKYVIPGAVIVVFIVYLLLNRQQSTYVASSVPAVVSGTAENANGNQALGGATSAGSNPPVAAPAPAVSATTGAYRDGTYKGSVADAYFGDLQVEAVISGGKITDVQFPVYPNHSGHTAEVSQTDLPILKQEAIQSQSANVNIVSGATQTSEAYQQSLASALALAGK